MCPAAVVRLDLNCQLLAGEHMHVHAHTSTHVEPSMEPQCFLPTAGIPPCLAEFVSCTFLNLDHNVLTSLTGLPPLPGLRCLHVSHNQLTSLEGLKDAQLSRLQVLDIRQGRGAVCWLAGHPISCCNTTDTPPQRPQRSHNHLTSVELDGDLPELQSLLLEGNDISCTAHLSTLQVKHPQSARLLN
jgi:hypothetical protein